MEMLQLNDLHKTFNPGTVNEKVALNGVSLHMEAGDFATIVGSNGAGKSTLFNAITGGFIADEGSILLGGQDITFEPEHQRSKVIGHLFQDPLKGTAPNMTIEENLALAYLRAGTAPHAIFSRISRKDKEVFREKLALAEVFSIVLSDILGDPLDMIASGPAVPDTSTCAQALAIAEKYQLNLSEQAKTLLQQETPKALGNVTTRITGSVRELCTAAANACRELGYEPILLTDQLCCEAREAGSFLGSIVRTHTGHGKKLAYIAGGETVVHLTGRGLGGRNQELALAAAPAIAGRDAAVFSVGSDGTDGPTDAAGGYVDGETLAALAAKGWNVFDTLQHNDAYHALRAVEGLIMTGATGTNVNDVAVALLRGLDSKSSK